MIEREMEALVYKQQAEIARLRTSLETMAAETIAANADVARLTRERDEYARQRNAQCEHDADEIAKLERERYLCEECGLPIAICNALASYRKTIDLFKRKEFDRGYEMAEFAKEEYDRYLNARRTTPSLQQEKL